MTTKEKTMSETGTDLAAMVEDARRRIREADPEAYGGFITDAAIRAVARRTGTDWRAVWRAYRAEHPANERRLIPPNALPVRPEALTVA